MAAQTLGVVDIIADIVGIVGVGLTLLAYFLLQIDSITSTGRKYSLLNLVGAVLIMYSLYFNWNTPAVIMECAWFGISLYGLIRHYHSNSTSH